MTKCNCGAEQYREPYHAVWCRRVRKPRMRYTGYIVLYMRGHAMACPRISSNNRASVRQYVRETALDIRRRRNAQA